MNENKPVETVYDESQIQVLEGLEAVRKRPGMYIGSVSIAGLHHLVYEIVDNSIDEALAGYCDKILVDINADGTVTVQDNGRGIPVGIHPTEGIPTVQVVLTILHAGGKFGGGGYKVSGGLHGVGSSVVNALSEKLEVEVSDGEHVYYQSYERGTPTCELKVIGDTDKTGTKITFLPDSEIFETLNFDYEVLLKRLREQAFLNKGVRIIFTDNRTEEKRSEELYAEGGIKEFVTYINAGKDPIHDEIVYFEAKRGDDMEVEIAMQYTTAYSETLLSFANNIHTVDGGMHETGFKAGLTRVLNDYARKHNMLKEKDDNLSGEDTREGLTAVISVKVSEAQFEGQTKTKLGNSGARTLVDNSLQDKFAAFLEENPKVARAIIDKTISASRAREAARKAREASRKGSQASNASLLGKLARCTDEGADYAELFIVEGDSAGGSAKQGRHRRFQAVLPLWGKMLNVEKSRIDKVYSNEKLLPVIQALGAGIGEDFNIDNLKYGKIVIMADADVDGAHIRTLLLTFFFRYMRPLIEEGHVYIAQPPLYKVWKGKNKDVVERFVFDEAARDEAIRELGKGAKVQRYKGLGEMDPAELKETTMDPEKRTMLRVDLEDAIEADRIFTLLMGEKVEPRRDFIEANAKYVSNLDI
ncbi:MAG: DNA topoisomerase (ATP-hydrolyzing) subunit B [Oscillospiraceae bacterium]|nr:DNA topoisomerase (ATP-hydrolyzing) subunit B [Oscillospiraceae bacterium]